MDRVRSGSWFRDSRRLCVQWCGWWTGNNRPTGARAGRGCDLPSEVRRVQLDRYPQRGRERVQQAEAPSAQMFGACEAVRGQGPSSSLRRTSLLGTSPIPRSSVHSAGVESPAGLLEKHGASGGWSCAPSARRVGQWPAGRSRWGGTGFHGEPASSTGESGRGSKRQIHSEASKGDVPRSGPCRESGSTDGGGAGPGRWEEPGTHEGRTHRGRKSLCKPWTSRKAQEEKEEAERGTGCAGQRLRQSSPRPWTQARWKEEEKEEEKEEGVQELLKLERQLGLQQRERESAPAAHEEEGRSQPGLGFGGADRKDAGATVGTRTRSRTRSHGRGGRAAGGEDDAVLQPLLEKSVRIPPSGSEGVVHPVPLHRSTSRRSARRAGGCVGRESPGVRACGNDGILEHRQAPRGGKPGNVVVGSPGGTARRAEACSVAVKKRGETGLRQVAGLDTLDIGVDVGEFEGEGQSERKRKKRRQRERMAMAMGREERVEKRLEEGEGEKGKGKGGEEEERWEGLREQEGDEASSVVTRATGNEAAGWATRAPPPLGVAAGEPVPLASFLEGWEAAAESFRSLGIWLAWGFLNGSLLTRGFCVEALFRDGRSFQEVGSRHRHLLPLRVFGPCTAWSLEGLAWNEVCFSEELSEDCWLYCVCRAINWLAGWPQVSLKPCRGDMAGRKCENECMGLLRSQIRTLLARDEGIKCDPSAIMQDLKNARIDYSGEEVLPMRPLCVDQMEGALPPLGAGGRVNALELVDGGIKEMLNNPERCMVDPSLREKCARQCKAHIVAGEEAKVARLLVERGVCKPIPLDCVARVEGQRVLNGLFGVPKPKFLQDGRPVLRTIMNFIPTNGLQKTIEGHVGSLPTITSWQSIVLGEGEQLYCYQSDMACAFYLFSLPECWLPWFALNFCLDGAELGEEPGRKYTIACATLPMGWRSAVGIMQCISRTVLLEAGLPSSDEIRKDRVVPKWLVECWRRGGQNGWWQVHLDNFISAEVRQEEDQAGAGKAFFERSQQAWDSAGILCAADKNVEEASLAFELGAELDGQFGKLSGGTLRMLKVCQASLCFALGNKGGRKELQVLGGRWAFLAQFRRPVFAAFSDLWKGIYHERPAQLLLGRASLELLMGCCLAPLVGADLRRPVSEVVIASDASERGGAFCVGQGASWSGCSLARFLNTPNAGPVEIPVLVISLFNGIGGAFRAYDLLGLAPAGLIAVECCKAANRVTSLTWPHAILLTNVEEITEETVKEWSATFASVHEVHLWGGFPCVHLSSVRHGRENLAGDGSNLFFQLLQVKEWIARWFSGFSSFRWVIENVASMDVSARDEISWKLGTEPLRLDPADVQCFSRPRFAWCSEIAGSRNDARVTRRKGFSEVTMAADKLDDQGWIQPGWERVSRDNNLPTFMKSIPRERPPPNPAGLNRTPEDAVARWESDEYRFPPCQYKRQFLLSNGESLRYANASERELLMGFGARHTLLCLPASQTKGKNSCWKTLASA